MQLKDLQRSVADRYANKGLSVFKFLHPPANGGIPSCGFVFADRVRFAAALRRLNRGICFGGLFFLSLRALRLCVQPFSRLFSTVKKCTIMHFSPNSVLNMHYNALFHPLAPAPPLKLQPPRTIPQHLRFPQRPRRTFRVRQI